MILADGACPLDGRPSINGLEKTLQMRVGSERIIGALAHAGRAIEPTPSRHIGNRIAVADDEVPPFQVVVQHLVMPLGFPAVSIHGVIEALGCGELEMHGLAGERAEARGDEQHQDSSSARSSGLPRNLPVFSAR